MLTGRDLIVYILENNLENEKVVDEKGRFLGFVTEEEAAARLNVGVEAIVVMYSMGMLNGIKMGDHLYFPNDFSDPRKLAILGGK